MDIVDAQIHLWTNDKAPPHHRQTPLLIEGALREMDAAGVDRAINCPAVWDPQSNAYAVEAATRHQDRFATLGWFDLNQAPSTQFVEDFVAQPGMLGLRFLIMSPDQRKMFAGGQLDWIWEVADRLALPVGFMLRPDMFGALADIARRFPRMKVIIDHLAAIPPTKMPDAMAHLDELLALAALPNIAVKTTGVTSLSTDSYPFASVEPMLRSIFESFGPKRMFWGTDITRLECTWSECVSHFAETLPWLAGEDRALVMGRAIRSWTGWR